VWASFEICRHRDDGFVHFVPKIRLGRFLELAENHGRNFRRRVFLIAGTDLYISLSVPPTTSYGTIFSSDATSLCRRPMKRLIEKTVRFGFVTA